MCWSEVAINRQRNGAHAPEQHGKLDPAAEKRNHFRNAHKNDPHDHAADQLPSLSGMAHQPLAYDCADHELRAEQRGHPQNKSGNSNEQTNHGDTRDEGGNGPTEKNQHTATTRAPEAPSGSTRTP